MLCLSCGLAYLSHANPYHPDTEVRHCRMTFESSWKPRTKPAKRVMWENDHRAYRDWLRKLNDLSEMLQSQIDSRRYSDFCVHFAYVTLRVLALLRSQLDKRIKQLDYVLQPSNDD